MAKYVSHAEAALFLFGSALISFGLAFSLGVLILF